MQYQMEKIMKLRHIVSVTFFLVLCLIAYLAVYLGAFKPVNLDMGEFGPYQLVYKKHLGAYHKIVPVIEEVEKWVRTQGETCRLSFGEYIDDPKQVEQSRLRSQGGCIVSKPLGPLPKDFEQRELPKQFFIRGQFDGSPAIGPYKVYLKANEMMETKGLIPNGPVFELYEILPDNKMKTEYLFSAKLKD
jgi:hypothetical protein